MQPNDSDGADDAGPVVTRRQTLAGLGAAGILGISGAHAGAQDGGGLDHVQATWTARHRQRVSQYAAETALEASDDVAFAGEKYSTLTYLGASWSENGNPEPGVDAPEGAWRHTFLLSDFVAFLSAEDLNMTFSSDPQTGAHETRYYVPEDASYDLDEAFSVAPSVTVEASGEGDAPRQPSVSVSPVRDADLFGFLNWESFDEAVTEQVQDGDGLSESELQSYLDGIATGDVGEGANWNDVLRTVRAERDAEEDRDAVLTIVETAALLALSTTGAGAVAASLYSAAKFVASLLANSEEGDEPVAFFDGFEQEYPMHSENPLGGAFTTVDVYVAPETDGSEPDGRVDFTVETTMEQNDYQDVYGELTFDSSWTVEVTGAPPGGDGDVPNAEAYSAEIVDFDASEPVSETEPGTPPLEFVNESPPHDPDPTITPPDPIATAPGQPLEPVTKGETYRFGAHETLRAGAKIASYDWTVVDPFADDDPYGDLEGDVVLDVPVQETNAPYLEVQLTVEDDDGRTGSTDLRVPVGSDHAAIDPQIELVHPDRHASPVVGETVPLTGAASSAEAGVARYEWSVTSFPSEFPEQAERYYRGEVGEEFHLPTLVPGQYTVSLRVVDELERSAAIRETFEVTEADPDAEIVRPSGDIVRQGEPETLRVDHTGFAGEVPDENVTWRVDGQELDATGPVVSHTFEQADDAVVVLEVTVLGPDDEQEATDEHLVTVEAESGDLPVDIEGLPEPVVGLEASYSAEVDGSRGSLDYRWEVTVPGDGSLPDDSGFTQWEPPRESGLNDGGSISGTFVEPEERHISLVVTDEAGNTGRDTMTVEPFAEMDVTIDAPDRVDEGDPATLTAVVENPPEYYDVSWDGAVSGTDETIEVTFDDTGYVDVSVTVTEPGNGGEPAQTASDEVTVFVDDEETVSIGATPDPVEPGQEVELTAVTSGFEDTDGYRWTLPDDAEFGLSSNAGMIHPRTITGTFDDQGQREVSVTARDANGAGVAGDTASATEEVLVREDLDVELQARVDVGWSSDSIRAWTQDTVEFEAEVTGATGNPSFDWTFLDSDDASGTYSWSHSGNYRVEVEVTDDYQTVTDSVSVEVEEIDVDIETPVVDVYVGDTVSFEATVRNAQGSLDYDWHVEDGDFGLSSYAGFNDPREISGEFTDDGTKEVSVSVQDDGGHVASATESVSVQVRPDVEVTLSADPSTVEAEESTTLTADLDNTTGPPDVTWIGARGSGTRITESWDTVGQKEVGVRVDDPNGTSDTDYVDVDVELPAVGLEIDYSTHAGTGSYDFEAVTNSGVSVDSYTWWIDGDRQSTDSSELSYSFNTEGYHDVEVELDLYGTTVSTSQEVYVYLSR